jgi:hypothetical protein
MKTHIYAAATLAALFVLGGCNGGSSNAANNSANAAEAAAPVELPPPLVARTYRCADNSVIHADFAADGSFAMVGTSSTGARTRIVSAQAGKNYSGEGYTIAANADDTQIQVPGKSAQRCRTGGH